ncbi:mitotic checkpoint serine/threonine-protein kinase BUB1-like [Salvia splendens]|uniref:mitotic checkpoint serine/threonine-protein kinase BUB1-like n=1 Tax=Salvia splendens TaxID=180675 RepID=UPI001C27FEB0|nr:mitotic checkpoint serine/threonine-protein kinase BUB1-like [Salvia splendens]
MAVVSTNSGNVSGVSSSAADDPILPSLQSIYEALRSQNSSDQINFADFDALVANCINSFKSDPRYRDDIRFLKIWFLYMDGSSDYERVFKEMEEHRICVRKALLYESFALFLEAKGKLIDACMIYHLGISRNAEPLGRLKKAQVLFLERMSERVSNESFQKMKNGVSVEDGENFVNPWSVSTLKNLLQKMNSKVVQYEGYLSSNKAYPGKVALSTLQKSAKNKSINIGGENYQIKGCAGQGGFAQVFKAYVDSSPDHVVALKIQKPPFPWEFYMYRQLDIRIPEKERKSFGFAHTLHLYSDYSVLVTDYFSHGTLLDAINSNDVIGGSMDEVLCIYYTIEMLQILETLHCAAMIHGDFKPDNLLIRYSRDDPTEDVNDFRLRAGTWGDQGLCLVDWGRGIDLSSFPEGTKFMGDSRTSGFRCIEMQEKRPWTFQVDLYGLCVIVHMMLHNKYMEIEKSASPEGGFHYQPKAHFKRYWNVDLWKNLFAKLLNSHPNEDHRKLLQSLRESLQDYMCSDQKLIKKLKELLVKQRISLCSS